MEEQKDKKTIDNYSTPLIDRKIFFGNPEISGAQISPDGKFVTFIKALDGTMNIWIKAKEDGFEDAVPLTNDTKRPIRSYFWSRDSKFIIYAQDAGGDENFALYVVNPIIEHQGQIPEASALTPTEGTHSYVLSLPKSQADKIYVAVNDRDMAWHDCYCYNIATGERSLVLENDGQYNSFFLDLEGNVKMVGRSLSNGGNEILWKDGNDFKNLFTASLEESIVPIRFRPDGKVYFSSNLGETDLAGLYLFDPESKELKLIESDPQNEVDLENVSFSYITDELIATIYCGDKKRIYWKDDNFKNDFELLEKKFEEAEVSITSTTSDEKIWIIYVATDRDPGSAYLFDRSSKEIDFLYKPRPELPVEHLVNMLPVRYNSLDGLEIPAYLSFPSYHSDKALPAVIFVHGGPWARDYWGYNSFAQFLANRGYAVLQSNFRGSTGFGKKFLNAAINEWGEKMQDDLTAGYHYLVEKHNIDPERVAIVGGSYGGYATLAGLCFTPDIYAAGVSIVGPSNLFTLLETIPPYWESAREMFHKRMGDPTTEEGRAQLKRQSPFFHAHNIKAPLLVAQGANDPRVKKSESDQIVIAMRDHGLPVEYINFHDEGHGFANPENNLAFISVMEAFLAKHLGGRYQSDILDETKKIIDKATVDISKLEMPKIISDDILNRPMPFDTFEAEDSSEYYIIKLELQGQNFEYEIQRDYRSDGDLMTITDHASSDMGQMSDQSTIKIEDGRAVRRHLVQEPLDVKLEIRDDSIDIESSVSGQLSSQQIRFDQNFVLDGAHLDNYITQMDKSKIDDIVIRVFDSQMQRFNRYKSIVEFNNEYDMQKCHKVQLNDPETDELLIEYVISDTEEPLLLYKTSVLKQMNGAHLKMERRER